jgi:hypothetical protein
MAVTVALRGASRSSAISPTIRPVTGADQQKRDGLFALLQQHLSRRRVQRAQVDRKRPQ